MTISENNRDIRIQAAKIAAKLLARKDIASYSHHAEAAVEVAKRIEKYIRTGA